MKLLQGLLILFFCCTLQAELIELQNVSMEARSYTGDSREPIIMYNSIQNHNIDKELRFNINMDLLTFFYFNNTVNGQSDTGPGGQFRTVGYKFETGLRVATFLDLEYGHHSRHVLDSTLPVGFPVSDYIGIRINLYGSSQDFRKYLIPGIIFK